MNLNIPQIKKERDYTLEKLNVSRETIKKLDLYVNYLISFQEHTNLISNSSLSSIWNRHILDSSQIINYFPNKMLKILDVGTGAGFPGIILSILTDNEIILIDSSKKKCKFLSNVINLVGLNAKVVCRRVEDLEHYKADIITARAVSSIERLLKYTKKQIHSKSVCYFFKGENYIKELKYLERSQNLTYELIPSITNNNSTIIKVYKN